MVDDRLENALDYKIKYTVGPVMKEYMAKIYKKTTFYHGCRNVYVLNFNLDMWIY